MAFTFVQRRHIDSKDALYLGFRINQERDDKSITENTEERCVYVVVHAVSEAVSQMITAQSQEMVDHDQKSETDRACLLDFIKRDGLQVVLRPEQSAMIIYSIPSLQERTYLRCRFGSLQMAADRNDHLSRVLKIVNSPICLSKIGSADAS